ncbi:MAG: aminotransferase class I/II-fold pyridoxal phosphate-dependent enzyme [Bacteroidales bacterium]|nr:aminotransferase class I/II-fold pyridoxal phosphate-dependent enzyme [Candidatus Liminaster caballi]
MQAIILAAGMGKRLGEYTKENTKCMVPVNGTLLIDRSLDLLSELDLRQIIIVVGYYGQKVIDHVGNEHNGIPVRYIWNPIFDSTNNIYSLSLAKDEMCKDDTLLLESDLIYDAAIIRQLVSNPYPNLALVAKYQSWMDGTMVKIDDESNIVSFVTKAAFDYKEKDSYYKTINIYKFSKDFCASKYVPFLEAYTKSVGNNEYYENVLRIISFLNSHDLKALPIHGEKWYEIDDKQDLDIAEALFSEPEALLKKYYTRYGGFWRFPDMLDFCYLVNPYFRQSKIIDELEANFRTLLGEYPSGMKVNTLLASRCWGVREEYIIPGNGAAELIKALMENIDGRLGVVRPTFEEYPNRINQDNVVAFVPQNRDFRYGIADLNDFFGANPVDTLLLINPDNPSGNFIPLDDVLDLATWCELRGMRLIVDESFVDFSDHWQTATLLHDDYLEQHPHLVVMKSISKSYGVPGLRLGILASADTALIAAMKKQVSIWNINSFAEFFMQIFTKYEADYHKACTRFIEVRADFLAKLNEIPFLHVMPTQANFVLCEVLPPFTANDIALTLLKNHNILISACSAKKGIDKDRYVRMAVRSKEDNDRLIEALKLV